MVKGKVVLDSAKLVYVFSLTLTDDQGREIMLSGNCLCDPTGSYREIEWVGNKGLEHVTEDILSKIEKKLIEELVSMSIMDVKEFDV